MRSGRLQSFIAGLATFALVSSAAPIQAHRVVLQAEFPVCQMVRSELVVVGKVVEIEKEPITAKQYPGGRMKATFQIAIVKISEKLSGRDGLTHVRIGFVPSTNLYKDVEPGDFVRGEVNHNLVEGFDGCFFLTKHHEADFYVQRPFGQALSKGQPSYDQQYAKLRKMSDAFRNPLKALDAKEPADRLFAACVLLQKYRMRAEAVAKEQLREEAVPGEISKKILQLLASADWEKVQPEGESPANAFWTLQLSERDGFKQPEARGNIPYARLLHAAFAKWVEQHGDSYVVQRFVLEKKKN